MPLTLQSALFHKGEYALSRAPQAEMTPSNDFHRVTEDLMVRPLKLYHHSQAPNPRRVRIFAAEKGIELALEEIDILAGQSRTPEFLAKNSSGAVPVLELDDGSYLSESVAICRYLEGLHPEPNLFGRDLRERAEVERWNRRMELELFAPIARTVQNTSPIFQGRFKQFPEYGEEQRGIVYRRLERMDRELSGHQFVADRSTIADITALVAIDIGRRLADIKIAPEFAHLTRWHDAVSERPSAKA
jgi:glutathione S-transferase